MDSKRSNRRGFLKQETVLAGLAAVGVISAAHGETTSEPQALPDPWTGKTAARPARQPFVDWTGTPE
jgi:hypothetical protein